MASWNWLHTYIRAHLRTNTIPKFVTLSSDKESRVHLGLVEGSPPLFRLPAGDRTGDPSNRLGMTVLGHLVAVPRCAGYACESCDQPARRLLDRLKNLIRSPRLVGPAPHKPLRNERFQDAMRGRAVHSHIMHQFRFGDPPALAVHQIQRFFQR